MDEYASKRVPLQEGCYGDAAAHGEAESFDQSDVQCFEDLRQGVEIAEASSKQVLELWQPVVEIAEVSHVVELRRRVLQIAFMKSTYSRMGSVQI